MYCGSKVAVSDDLGKERLSLARYVELLLVATEAGNNEDILRYSNSILEINPTNITAWIQKAVATFCLTLQSSDDGLTTALVYLERADALGRDREQVDSMRSTLVRAQAD